MLLIIVEPVIKYPASFGIWASLLQQNVFGLYEIAIVGSNADNLSLEVLNNYIPYKIIMSSAIENEIYPILKWKPATLEPLIYVCKNYECLNPFKTIDDFKLHISKPVK